MSLRKTLLPVRQLSGIGLTAAMLVLAGCSSDSSSTDTASASDDTSSESDSIVFSFKETGGDEPEYLISQVDVMNTALSAQGAGFEQLGWNFYYPVGDTLFVTGYENFETQSYKLDENGDIQLINSFVFENPLEVFGATEDNTLLATDGPRDGTHTLRRLYIADAGTGQVTRQVSYQIDDVDTGTPGEGTVGWPTAMVVRDDKLFVPFHKLDDAGNFTTPDVDTAYVAVYDWPLVDNATPEKVITDERTGHIGVNGMSTAMIKTEEGDLYAYSNGALSAGFNPASSKPSGIVKIANGETEFDQDYFFDIEAAADGGKLFWFDYIGDNKALGRIVTSNEGEYFYSNFTKDFFYEKLVLIDLEAQTVSDVEGVPLHQKRYTSPLSIIDGVVYLSVETADENAVYAYDVATGVATKGGAIEGKTIKGFYDLSGT